MFSNFQKMRQGFSPLLGLDLLHQLTNFLLVTAWAAPLFYILHEVILDVSVDWQPWQLLIPIVPFWWLLIVSTWSNYRVLVAEQALLTPGQFRCALLAFLAASLLACFIHILAFVGVFGGVISFVAIFRMMMAFHRQQYIGKAGRFFWPNRRVRRYYRFKLKKAKRRLYWAGTPFPWEEAVRNFCLFGAISSGKTIMLRLYMQSILPRVGVDPDVKSVTIYDAKRDACSTVRKINSDCPLYILNPWDARCAWFRISETIVNREGALAVVAQFAPPLPAKASANTFWIEAAHYGMTGICLFFTIVAKENWRLADIFISLRSADRMLAILGSRPETQEFVYLLGGERLTFSVMCTIQVYLSKLAPIAAAFQEKERLEKELNVPQKSFTIDELINTAAIVLLGRDVKNIIAINAYNRLLITLMGLELLNLPGNDEARSPRNFFILDEFHTLGDLGLPFLELLTNGSGKGVSIALATQAYTFLQQIYGREGAETMMGQIFHKLFLRLNDHTTSAYASELIGTAQQFKQVFDSKQNKWITSDRVERVKVAPAEDLRRNHPPVKGLPGLFNKLLGRGGSPLTGYAYGQFGYWMKLSPKEISKRLMPKSKDPNVIPWDIPEIKTWNYADLERLGLTEVISLDDFEEHRQQEEATMRGASANYSEILRNIRQQLPDENVDDTAANA